MALTVGTRLGPYEILAPLGAGGMGEVYRARDTRLGRDVAVKVLPQHVSASPEDRARFKREAKTISSLNHPHICVLHDVGQEGDTDFLVMELVEGETLSQRIARGALPSAEVLRLGAQIADALDRAHRAGVVHRDLKPGNVMLSKSGAKLMDFGLAREARPVGGGAGAATVTGPGASPRSEESITKKGTIVGTFQYMSPEQLEGKRADARSDLWALGCVLYEMATGKRAFEGTTPVSVISAIMRGEPRVMTELAPLTPPSFERAVKQCLAKDPDDRWQSAGDLRRELGWILEAGSHAGVPAPIVARRRSARSVALATLVGLVGAVVGIGVWILFGPGGPAASASRPVVRSTIEIPLGIKATEGGISPDGRFLIVPGRPLQGEGEQASPPRLYRRRVDSYRLEEVSGSEGLRTFKFAPDGRWIYFTVPAVGRSTDLRLMKAPLDGSGVAASVFPWDSSWDPTWWIPLASGDFLVRALAMNAYIRVSANGAAAAPPIKLTVPGLSAAIPWIALPGDRGALLHIQYRDEGRFHRGTACLDLKRGTSKVLLRDGTSAVYAPTGHLVFLRQSTLFAVSFDLNALEIRGEPVAITEGVLEGSRVYLSRDGTLTYRYGGAIARPLRLAVADRQGRVRDWAPDPMALDGPPVVSPSGNRAAFAISSAKNIDEIWISERGSASRRRVVAMDGADCNWPVWSPDERQIAFYRKASDKEDGIYVQGVDGGAPRKICRSTEAPFMVPTSWSPNGEYLLATVIRGVGGDDVIMVVTDTAGDSLPPPVPLFSGPANHGYAYFSPDGHWVAYHSNEIGESEVYAAPFHPDGSLGTPLALGRGSYPAWSRGGREVYFLQGTDVAPRMRIASVSLRFEARPSASPPTPCWDLDSLRWVAGWRYWDILPGNQVLFVQEGEDNLATEPTRIACVTNFFDELRRKVREGGKR